MNLTRNIKRKIYDALVNQEGLFSFFESPHIVDFLEDIWNVSAMESEDKRFENAYDDFVQHLINNNDYTLNEVFFNRLKLINGDNETYQSFLETVVLPKYREDEEDIINYVKLISSFLEEEYTFVLKAHDDVGMPIYKIETLTGETPPIDISENDIVFYVEKSPKGRSDLISSHKKPPTFPSFVLVYNDWDDYGVKCSFNLYYYASFNSILLNCVRHKVSFFTEIALKTSVFFSFVSLNGCEAIRKRLRT